MAYWPRYANNLQPPNLQPSQWFALLSRVGFQLRFYVRMDHT
ncbi:hypothetical protein [Moorena sp. SIO1G6]|nr:hypothetical protein [Moorena sp. SIO1G6]